MSVTLFQNIAEEVIRKVKAYRQATANSRGDADSKDDFVVVNKDTTAANEFYAPLFQSFFIESEDHHDDMLYFVPATVSTVNKQSWVSSQQQAAPDSDGGAPSPSPSSSSSSSSSQTQQEKEAQARWDPTVEPFFVRRRTNKQSLPSTTDARINWEETFLLNFVVQHVVYTITVWITENRRTKLRKPGPGHACATQVVWACPSHRPMDSKGQRTDLTYPRIYFAIDNFDDIFADFVIKQSQRLIVTLDAALVRQSGPGGDSGSSGDGDGAGDIDSACAEDTPPEPNFATRAAPRGSSNNSSSNSSSSHINNDSSNDKTSPRDQYRRHIVFQGSVTYDQLRGSFEKARRRRKERKGMLERIAPDQVEYLALKGPGGRGKAQIAINMSRDGAAGSGGGSAGYGAGIGAGVASVLSTGVKGVTSLFSRFTTSNSSSSSNSGGRKTSAKKTVPGARPATPPSPAPSLRALMTFINLHWEEIIEDVLQE